MKTLANFFCAAMINGFVLSGLVQPSNATEPTMLIGHSKPVVDVEFSADGKSLASIAANGETILWDITAGTGRRGPKVDRELDLGGPWLQFTREEHSLLMAGCDLYGYLVDPSTNKVVSEWADPKPMKGHYPFLYVGGQRFVNRTSVVQAGSTEPLYTVGDRNPPLAAISPDGTKWFTNRNMPVGNDRQVQVLDSATGRVLCDLKAFTGAVKGVGWVDAQRVVTLVDGGSYGGSLMLWDVSGAGKLLSKIDLPGVQRLTVSGDGRVAAVALRDYKIALIDIGEKQLTQGRTINAGLWGQEDPTFSLSHDGSRVLAATVSDTRWQLLVGDTQSGAELLVHQRQHTDTLPELSPDGQWVAFGHANGQISLWPVAGESPPEAAGLLTQILDKPLEQPSAPGLPEGIRNLFRPYSEGRIVVSPSGEFIVTSQRKPNTLATFASMKAETHLPVWETTSTRPWKKELPTWALLSDGTFLVEGTIVGNEKIPNLVSGRVNPATGEYQIQSQHRPLHFSAMQPSPDGKVMAARASVWTWENNRRLQSPESLMLLDMQTGKTLKTLAAGLGSVAPGLLVFSANGERLAFLENWKLRVFETASGEELPLAGEWDSEQFWFLDNGKTLARLDGHSSVVGVDLDTQAEVFRWKTSEGQTGEVSAVEISLDGTWAAVGGKTGDLTLRNPRTGAVLHRFQPMTLPISGIGFSPDGSVIAAADEQRHLMAWKVGALEQNAAATLPPTRREIKAQ